MGARSVIREVHPMHQQLRSFYRHLLQGLTVGLSALGLFSSAARSHHDDVPDPPPQSSSNHLAALPNLVPTAITVSGISSGGFFCPPVPRRVFQAGQWSRNHSRGALCLRGECPEPILRILDSPSGSGFGGDGRLHALLRQLLFRFTPFHTES